MVQNRLKTLKTIIIAAAVLALALGYIRLAAPEVLNIGASGRAPKARLTYSLKWLLGDRPAHTVERKLPDGSTVQVDAAGRLVETLPRQSNLLAEKDQESPPEDQNSPWLVDLERRKIEPQNISMVLPAAWRSDVCLGNQIGSVTQVQPPPQLETEDHRYSFSIFNETKWEKEFRQANGRWPDDIDWSKPIKLRDYVMSRKKMVGDYYGPLQVEFLTEDIAVLSSASGSFREAYVYQRNNLVWFGLHGEPPGKFVDFFKEALLTVEVLEE